MTKNSKYEMQEPNGVTKLRLLEIKLYLFTTTFLNKLGKHSSYKPELIGILCNANNIDTTAILTAINTLEHPNYKPTLREIAISSHLMGITVRTLTSQGIVSSGNYYKILQEYIDDYEPALQPKLQESHHEAIQIFFDQIDDMFRYVTNITRSVIE